jgi:diacylglycerol kinase (ATP)
MRPTGWLETVNCAIEGILWAAKTQRNMRWHFVAAVIVLLTGLFLHISALEFTLLAFAVTLVLFAELINTATEVLVDFVSPDYNLLARRAKDVAAGAVLVACIGAVVIGYLVLSPHFYRVFDGEFTGLGQVPGEHSVVAVLTVIILVVLLKAKWGKGAPLHGGMPSGHAAVAFSIATSIAVANVGLILIFLTMTMAVMVSQSRLLLRIHTLREVVAGALLGIGVTLAIYKLFP